ncbi:MAG: FixH family protein [Myxococcota bacterium]
MKRLVLAVFLSLLTLACGPAPVEAPKPTSVASVTEGALTVELLSLAPLAVGQNRLFYKVTQDGKALTEAHLHQHPLMTMPTMQHSCPKVDPAHEVDTNGYFMGTVIFNMPSDAMNTWDLKLEVTPHGASTATTVTFEKLAIADSTAKKMLTMNGMATLVTLGFTAGAPKVGVNEYTVSVHRPKDMMKMEYLPVTDLSITGTPEMPSMGHGSSGNVDPVHVSDGLYTGTVNFSMAGDWVLHLDLKAGDMSLGKTDFAWDL